MQLSTNPIVHLSTHSKNKNMNNQKTIAILMLSLLGMVGLAQEDDPYVEFNDRNNIVHGVYLGLTTRYGEIDQADTFTGGLQVAYVANQQFEVGFEGVFIYSDQDAFNATRARREDLIGGYGGLHLEPIFFSRSRVNLSFPLLIGAGGIGVIDDRFEEGFEEDLTGDDFDAVFVAEPGISALFNISRYLQIEAGIKYRFSSKIDLVNSPVDRINGFSGGIGIKVGVFNIGRNRYKKTIDG